MNIKKLKISKQLYGVPINCVPARIRHCNGFILETVTTQPDRKIMFKLMEELSENHGYNIYALRHKENDWSEPSNITRLGVLINRFGWFLSKDDMKFKKLRSDIRLGTRNALYYNVTTDGIYEEAHYGSCRNINVLDYFSIEAEIFK